MDLLIYTMFSTCILGGILGFVIYKSEKRYDNIQRHYEQIQEKRRQNGSN